MERMSADPYYEQGVAPVGGPHPASRSRNAVPALHIGVNALQVRAAKSGVGQYIAGLVEALLQLPEFDAANHRLTLFATPENAPNYAFRHPRYEVRIVGRRGERLAKRRLREWLVLPGIIRAAGIDVWHGPSNFLPLWRVPDCAYVVTLHDVSYWLHPGRVTLAKNLYWRGWTWRTIQLADGFITASRHARQTIGEVLGVPGWRFDLIPHAAHARFKPDLALHALADAYWQQVGRPGHPLQGSAIPPVLHRLGLLPGGYVLCIATLEPGKNARTLVEAFSLLKQERRGDPRYDRLKLVLVGDQGWLMGPLLSSIREGGHPEDVVLTGHLPDAELPDLLNGCGVFGFLSLNEGFGLPPLEALACGVPVVASQASSLPEVLGEAVLFVPALDARAAADALGSSMECAEIRKFLRTAGPAQAGRYNWQRTALLTLGSYKRAWTSIAAGNAPA